MVLEYGTPTMHGMVLDFPSVTIETRFRKRKAEVPFGDIFWVCRRCGLHDHEDEIVNVELNTVEEVFSHIAKHYAQMDKDFHTTLESLAKRMSEES